MLNKRSRKKEEAAEFDRKDILACIIAIYQLFSPLVIALLVTGLIVAGILHLTF